MDKSFPREQKMILGPDENVLKTLKSAGGGSKSTTQQKNSTNQGQHSSTGKSEKDKENKKQEEEKNESQVFFGREALLKNIQEQSEDLKTEDNREKDKEKLTSDALKTLELQKGPSKNEEAKKFNNGRKLRKIIKSVVAACLFGPAIIEALGLCSTIGGYAGLAIGGGTALVIVFVTLGLLSLSEGGSFLNFKDLNIGTSQKKKDQPVLSSAEQMERAMFYDGAHIDGGDNVNGRGGVSSARVEEDGSGGAKICGPNGGGPLGSRDGDFWKDTQGNVTHEKIGDIVINTKTGKQIGEYVNGVFRRK